MSYYNKLIEKYEKSLSDKPESINAVINLARLYLKTEDIEKSIGFYDALLDPMPKNVEILKSMGVLYLAKNNKDEAIKYIKEALLLDNNDPILYEYAAEIDYEKADKCYEIALNIYKSKKHTEVESMHCFLIAMKLYKKCKYEISIEYLDIIKNSMGNTVEYRNLLASIYYKTEKYDEAIEEYNKAENLLGYRNSTISINISACYRKKGDLDSALKLLNEALNTGDEKEIAYYNIALIYMDKSDNETALLNVRRSLSVRANYEPAKKLYENLSQFNLDTLLPLS